MGRASHSVSWRRRRDCRRARCIERSGRCRSVASRPNETMRATCWGRSCSGSRSSSTAASICACCCDRRSSGVRATLNETVHVGVLDGPDVVYVDKLESTRPLSLTSTIGGRNPAHATAVGKALLAWAYPTQASIIEWVRHEGPLVRRTSRTIVAAEPPREGVVARSGGRVLEGPGGERAGRAVPRDAGLLRRCGADRRDLRLGAQGPSADRHDARGRSPPGARRRPTSAGA